MARTLGGFRASFARGEASSCLALLVPDSSPTLRDRLARSVPNPLETTGNARHATTARTPETLS